MTGVLIRRENLTTDTHKGKTMYRDTGRRWSSTSQGKRPEIDTSSQILKRNKSCRHLDLRFLASRTVKYFIFYHFSYSLWYFVMTLLANKHRWWPSKSIGSNQLLKYIYDILVLGHCISWVSFSWLGGKKRYRIFKRIAHVFLFWVKISTS